MCSYKFCFLWLILPQLDKLHFRNCHSQLCHIGNVWAFVLCGNCCMFRLFEAFLNRMKASFGRIVKATKEEMSLEDLQSDAWIAAHEIGEKRGREIDFADPDDQKLLLGALHIRNVRRPEKNIRYAARIDQSREGEEGEVNSWVNRLRADDASEPLTFLERRESARDESKMLMESYSQAAAYVALFVRFENNRENVCAYLVISGDTLSRRVDFAAATVRRQRSLFDRIERIPADFMPPRGYAYPARIEASREAGQCSWAF